MSDGPLMRTEYWNVSTGTVRTGATGHGESLTDVENYLLPMDRVSRMSLYGWGVAIGLRVIATPGGSAVTIEPGVSLDSAGQLIILAANGVAITDPNVDPNDIQNIPTVTVPGSGIQLATPATSGDFFLTVTWREVLLPENALTNAPALLHAPWLRLVPVNGFADAGKQVVLATATLDAAGKVAALTGAGRRLVGVPTGRLELRVPQVRDGAVHDVAAAEIQARPDGGLDLNLLMNADTRPALSINGATGVATFPASIGLNSAAGRSYRIFAGDDSKLHFTDATGAADRLVIDSAGNVGIGIGAGQAQRPLHVEGSEVHSGGGAAGFSFADRGVGSLVDNPGAGERWVWYASAGAARLWSGFDRLTVSATGEGGGLDVPRRMRVRQGGDASAGIWFRQTAPDADRAFVGMSDDTHVGLYGSGGGWGLQMDTTSRFVTFAGDYGQRFGPSTIALWGSSISDVGGGVLTIRTGGTVISLIGQVQVNGNLDVRGRVSKAGGGFRIDHPLDPAGKYLEHSFAESPDRLNIYSGTVVTDEAGAATIALPDYFEALNRDPRYQLTPIGQPALVAVVQGVRDNRFAISTDKPGVAVSWQVTGIRRDAWATANPMDVEQRKPEAERERFLHPELIAEPESTGLFHFDPNQDKTFQEAPDHNP